MAGTTFDDAGRLQGDLTPACAAALTRGAGRPGQKAGPEDTRTLAQRRHDAIEEACRRLISGQMIPGQNGQPPHLIVHVDLNDLRGTSPLERAWTPAMTAAGPGSVYLRGPAAAAAACDAALTPIVTGQIDWNALDQLTTAWLTLHTHSQAPDGGQAPDAGTATAGTQARPTPPATARPPATATTRRRATPRPQVTARPQMTAPQATAAAGPPHPASSTRRPGPGCRPPSCKPASTSSPDPAGSPPICAARCSAPPTPPSASRWTSAAPPAPSRPTCAPPSSSGISTASSPAAGNPRPSATCTT